MPFASSKASIHDALVLTLNLHWRGTKNEEKAVANFAAVEVILGPTFPVARVDSTMVSRLIDAWKRQGLSNGSVNRKLSALGKVLQTAFRAGMRKEGPPSGLRLKEAKGRTRVLTADEVSRLCGVMQEEGYQRASELVVVLVETGMRVGEALALRESDIRMYGPKSWSVRVRDSKNGMPREIPLTTPASNLLLCLRAACRADDLIFTLSQRSFNAAWASARRAMGLEHDPEFVPHALRHTCASRLVSAGVPLAVVQKWLGHKSITMTMRYAHLGDASLVQAAEVLDKNREKNK